MIPVEDPRFPEQGELEELWKWALWAKEKIEEIRCLNYNISGERDVANSELVRVRESLAGLEVHLRERSTRQLQLLDIGSEVLLRYSGKPPVLARVYSATIYKSGRVEYRVHWWAHGILRQETVSPDEIEDPDILLRSPKV